MLIVFIPGAATAYLHGDPTPINSRQFFPIPLPSLLFLQSEHAQLTAEAENTATLLHDTQTNLAELTHDHGALQVQHAQLAATHEEATAALEVKTAGATELRELLYEAAHNLAIQLEPLQQVGARHCTGMLCTYFVVLWQ